MFSVKPMIFQVCVDGPALRVVGQHWGGGAALQCEGVAGQPRPRRGGRATNEVEEDNLQRRLQETRLC